MKKLLYTISLLLFCFAASAQCLLIVNTTVTPTTSCTANDGMISYIITGGIPPYEVSYTINGNTNYSFSSPITNLQAGSYFLQILDSTWCYDTATVFVPNPNQIYLNPVITDVTGSCQNCNGAITLNSSGGVLPLTYVWNNSSSTSSISNLCAGNYWVNVYDAAGCSEYRYFTVIDQYTAGINFNATQHYPACQLCDGWINLNPTSGTPPYSYQWSNGATVNAINNLCGGAYTVTVTDGLGCTKTNSIWLPDSVGYLFQSQFNAAITNESCHGAYDGSIQITYNIPSTNFIYNWSNGSTTQNISNLNSNVYYCYVVDTVAHQCFILQDSLWGGFGVGVNSSGSTCGTISGRIYFDSDQNCNFTTGDYGISSSNAYALINPGNFSVYPDAQGFYSESFAYGAYNVSHQLNFGGSIGASCNPLQYVILNSTTPVAANIDFADTASSIPDLYIFANCSTTVSAAWTTVFDIWLGNMSFNSGTGTVYFVMDSVLSFASASITPSYINGDTLFWSNQFAALLFPAAYIEITCNVSPSTPIGYVLNLCAGVIPNGPDAVSSNNIYCFQKLVNGAFDPNEKSVTPVGVGPNGNVILNQQEFTYMVRFQNTGTAPAQNVIIRDTLSSLLDWSSFRVLHSSHNYTAQVDANGIVQFKFQNINLPDSGSSQALSHGYIQYEINRAANVQAGNQVKNTAHIYFDFNPAVITNTVNNTFVTANGVVEYAESLLNIFPNPTHDELNISFTGTENKNYLITLCDVTGRIHKSILIKSTLDNGTTKLNLKNISNGIYVLKVTDTNGLQVASQKVVVN